MTVTTTDSVYAGAAMLADLVQVRPVWPDDLEPVRSFLAGLSPDSSYRRFFAGVGRMSDRLVRHLVQVDHDRREAVVATVAGQIVGLADYALVAGRVDEAELGVVVADGWQRQGIGPRLVGEALALARRRGVRTLRVHTLAENGRVERMLRRAWPGARPCLDGTLLIWTLPLPPRGRGGTG
jgi:GNAT superfamily N-acetyltransferase